MLRINVTIEGLSPYVPHRFNEAAQLAVSGGVSAVAQERLSPQERAESFLYKDEKGKPIVVQPAILGAIISAGKFHKLGQSKITTHKTSLIPGYMVVVGAYFPLIHKQPWKVDSRPVKIPANGARIIEHRPMFDDWRITFEIEIFDGGFSEKLTRQLVDDAGLRIGLGDMRPEKKGPFGRFNVIKWDAKDLKKAA